MEKTPKRNITSSNEKTPENVNDKVASLENRIQQLSKRLEEMEKDSGIKIKWGVRYSQRIAILANVMLGVWHVWSEFVALLQQRRKSILQSLLSHNKTKQIVNNVFTESYQFSVWKSSFYFISALLIFSKYSWKRTIGLLMSCFGILYFPLNYFVGNYLTLFANLLYVTAAWSCSKNTIADNESDRVDFWESFKKYLLMSFKFD